MKDINVNKQDNMEKLREAHNKYLRKLEEFVTLLKDSHNLTETEDEFVLGELHISDRKESVLESMITTPIVLKKKSNRV